MELLPGLHRALRRLLILRGVNSAESRVAGFPVHHYSLKGSGKGPPIVLVHGLGGSANGFYKLFFPLARRFSRVIAPDLPGCGFSALPADCAALPAQRQLEVLEGFLEQEVRDPAFVVGTSLGGALCVTLAHRAPQRLVGLALIAPAGAKVSEARLQALISSFEVRSNAQARRLTRRLFHRTPLSALLLAGDLRRLYGAPPVQAVLRGLGPSESLDPALLGALTLPTLLIWGESEKLLPEESLDYFRTHLPPHAEIQRVPGFGHVPQFERPAELARRLVSFADRSHL